jgi:hypothetical protein
VDRVAAARRLVAVVRPRGDGSKRSDTIDCPT